MRFLSRLVRRVLRRDRATVPATGGARREHVLALAAQGLDAAAIARRTRLAHDVVPLMLATARAPQREGTVMTRQKRPAAA